MRRGILFIVAVPLAAAGAWAWVNPPWATAAPEAAYRTQRVERGAVTASVAATGTINPISTVIVGSQISGQVIEIVADYNDVVRTGQLMARLNTDQVRARLDGARADLLQSQAQAQMQEAQVEKNRADRARAAAALVDVQAQVRRAEAQLADAEATFGRTTDLARRSISTEVQLQQARTQTQTLGAALDSSRAQVGSAQASITALEADEKVIAAQLASARANVQQREAVIRQIEVDIRNAEIRSPVDGVVVQRNVELGQTVAASLQAPTLFLVAEDLRTMRIFANVDETDVGRVRPGQNVTFQVNAFPGRTFEGRVEQVRLGSQTVQNVVIYTAVITVANPGSVLMPGMTANLRILTEQREGVLRVPNAALRWRPPSEAPTQASAPAANPFGGGAPRPAQGARPQGAGGAPMAEFVQSLRSELRLTAAQGAELDRILADLRASAQGAGGGENGNPAQRREAFARLREEMTTRVAAILTDEQRPRLDALRERLAAERGTNGGANRGTAGRVFIVGADGQAEPVTVRLGATDGAMTEVLGRGRLDEGAAVIVGGRGPQGAARSFRFGL